MDKLLLISSEYGVLHLFLQEGDDEELAHAIYRYTVEDLYDNEAARACANFGQGVIGREAQEWQGSGDSEGESSPGSSC